MRKTQGQLNKKRASERFLCSYALMTPSFDVALTLCYAPSLRNTPQAAARSLSESCAEASISRASSSYIEALA